MESTSTKTIKKNINVSKSSLHWVGKKILGSHTGTLNFKDGFITFEDGIVTGGKFTVDMTSINVTDLSGDLKKQLEGHLNSDDFFSTSAFTTAQLEFKNVTEKSNQLYQIEAHLTIKGQTHPVTFELKVSDDKAETEFKVNRTLYGIRYGSGSFFSNLGDNTISDHFSIKTTLKF